jgi:hypothetical protein
MMCPFLPERRRAESSSQELLDFDHDPDLMTMIMEARIFFLPHDTTRRMGTNWLYTRLGWKQKCMGIEISTRSGHDGVSNF